MQSYLIEKEPKLEDWKNWWRRTPSARPHFAKWELSWGATPLVGVCGPGWLLLLCSMINIAMHHNAGATKGSERGCRTQFAARYYTIMEKHKDNQRVSNKMTKGILNKLTKTWVRVLTAFDQCISMAFSVVQEHWILKIMVWRSQKVIFTDI